MSTSGRAVGKYDTFPPQLPIDHIYTRCYCEENVYLLCRQFLERKEVCEQWEVWVVFISNKDKTVVLWEQQAAQDGAPIVWDYHVILVLKARGLKGPQGADIDIGEIGNWVYDFDTSITPMPCRLDEYIMRTFSFQLPPQYQSLFRLIPGQMFIDHFASDRSHMLRSSVVEGESLVYISPTPIYDPICGGVSKSLGVVNNLMTSFVCMDRTAGNTFGSVWSLENMIIQLRG